MKPRLLRSLLVPAVLLTAWCSALAQSTDSRGRIFDGEILKFEGNISKVWRSFSVAELTFNSTFDTAKNQLVIKSQAVSKGTLIKLFRYSFLQQYESTIDGPTFDILRTTKHDVQKERVRDSEAIFDYNDKRVRFVETDPKDTTRPPRRIASEIASPMYDIISAIYGVRMAPLSVGQRLQFAVSDTGLVYKVPFVVTAREQKKTIFGKVWCFRVEPEIFGKDRLIEKEGSMVIWYVDDERRTPVRSEVRTEYGNFTIKLKSSSLMRPSK
jgi:hypothetical protein